MYVSGKIILKKIYAKKFKWLSSRWRVGLNNVITAGKGIYEICFANQKSNFLFQMQSACMRMQVKQNLIIWNNQINLLLLLTIAIVLNITSPITNLKPKPLNNHVLLCCLIRFLLSTLLPSAVPQKKHSVLHQSCMTHACVPL